MDFHERGARVKVAPDVCFRCGQDATVNLEALAVCTNEACDEYVLPMKLATKGD